MSDKYAAIHVHRDRFPIRMMCTALAVSESGFYAHVERGPSACARADEQLLVHVRATFTKSRRRYGAPRVHHALRLSGIRVAKKRVARLMQADGLVARRRKRSVCTTQSAHANPIAPNLLARAFALAENLQPDRVWVGDITYIPTRCGWLYLAVLIDLATRGVVGWATSASLATPLPRMALQQAVARRAPAPGLIQHTDQGSQYASTDYRADLAAHQMIPSMSRRGNCWDNSVAESFFATLEHELLEGADFHSHREARAALAEFIDGWYNPERMHSTLEYRSPLQYEQQLRRMARAA